jgi:6,7-dimethyl-8-ribityllumazine synthase
MVPGSGALSEHDLERRVPAPEPELPPESEPDLALEPDPELSNGEAVVDQWPDAPSVEYVGPPVAGSEHAGGDFAVPDGYSVLRGSPSGDRKAVGIVVSRFNAAVTQRLLAGALDELEGAGVAREAITVMPVPGAFELPIAAMALAKTRRYACIVALGCVVRGETPHFDYVAGEAASGLQLAALETGVPVSFGVLTLESADQAEARIEKGAEAVRTGLEMADVFAQLRAAAAR